MKNRGFHYIIFFVWVSMLIYFYNMDTEAFVLFLILPPILGWVLYCAIKSGYFVLTGFFGLSFIATAITPAFFFMNKNDYSFSGFNAIKDFNFDIYEFLNIYLYVIFMLLLILIFTISLNKIFIKQISTKIQRKNNLGYESHGKYLLIRQEKEIRKKINNKIYTLYIVLFVMGVLVPLNMFMYVNGIGISTVVPEARSFKIVGILFYFRNYFVPVIITYLYFKSNRKTGITILLLLYAAFVGALSLSKGNITLICLPVVLFAFLDRKIARLTISAFYFLLLFGIVAWARQFVFLTDAGSFEMIYLIYDSFSIDIFSDSLDIVAVVGEFANRLYGASVLVLAHKFNLDNNITEAANFYLVNSEGLSNIIFNDVFGLVAVNDLVLGVGMGYLGSMILLANKNLLVLCFLAFITAIYLSISEIIVRKYITSKNVWAPAGYALGFFMIFFLFDANIQKFYLVIGASIAGLFLLDFKRNINSVVCKRFKKNGIHE